MTRDLNNNRGVVFVAALAIGLILISLSMAAVMIARTETEVSKSELNALKIFYAAEAGIEHSLVKARKGEMNPVEAPNFYGGAEKSYYATYDPLERTIRADTACMGPPFSSITVHTRGPFTGAMQAGGSIDIHSTKGTVTGDVDAKGIVFLDSNITHDGTETANNPNLEIPQPVWSEWSNSSLFDGFTGYFSLGSCDEIIGNTPPDGVYYINGSCDFNFNRSDFTLNGTIVVRGNMLINQVNNMTITPVYDNNSKKLPALVVDGILTITASSKPTFNGLVYAVEDISMGPVSINANINGAIVAGGNIDIVNSSNFFSLIFDEDLDCDHFSGGEKNFRVSSWSGWD